MEKIKLSILCESFKVDSNGKLYSISNAFEKLYLSQFPAKISFALVIFWTGEEFNKSSITTKILNHNGESINGSFFININIPFERYKKINFNKYLESIKY